MTILALSVQIYQLLIIRKPRVLTKRTLCDSNEHDTILWLHSFEQLGKWLLEAFRVCLRIHHIDISICIR